MRRKHHFPWLGFILSIAALAGIAFIAIEAFKQGSINNKDSAVHSALVNIRKEAEIIADGASYTTVCQDNDNVGFGLPVGIPQRNKIGQLVSEIVRNSPNPKTDLPVCSVSLTGDLIAIFSKTSQGFWCVDSKGYEGFGRAESFGGVCIHTQ